MAAGLVALGFGVLGALYAGYNTYTAAQIANTTRFVVLLPSFVEAAYCFLTGLIVWIIAAIGNAGARR